MKKIFTSIALFLSALTTTAYAQFTDGQNAAAVLGQSLFTTGSANNGGLSATSLSGPQNSAVDPTTGKLFVADAGNNRVLRYASAASFASGAAAEAVLGQPDFITNSGACTVAKMAGPNGVAFDASGNMFVTDNNNRRVLRFNSASSKTNGANADGVLGQSNFTNNGAATTQAGMGFPGGLAVEASTGNLYVADYGNNRVLRYNAAAGKANGANADRVLGQADFISGGSALLQNRLNFPSRVALDASGNLYVSDLSNRRVLRFNNASSKANGANADGVLGQTNFTSNALATSQNGMRGPDGLAVEASTGNLYVVDQSGSNRVLRFNNAASKADGANADGVLGQTNFTNNGAATSPSGMNLPTGVAVDATGNLYVTEAGNNRVTRFDRTPAPTITSFTPPSGVAGTAVTITGTNFTGASAVSFGGTNQPVYTVASATSITTTVPAGAGTGTISVTTIGGTATSATAFILNGQNATAVLGQINFTSGGGGLTSTTLSGPQGAAVDPTNGKLFVADANNNRVLRYASAASFANGDAAEAVLGQTLFTTNTSATSQAGMNGPNSVTLDASGNLFVTDYNNRRVLRFNAASGKANGANADGVLGQANYTSSATATTQAGMGRPTGAVVDAAGNLYVADGTDNNRVLRYNAAASKANGANADGVLGQANFTSGGTALTQSGMNFASRVAIDANGNLFVSDFNSRRVLRFNGAASKANGANADGVLGQANFTSNALATTQNGVRGPDGLAVDAAGNLYVVDQNGNNRVLRFNAAASKTNGANADGVLGQANFTSNGVATTQSGMNLPVNVAVDGAGNVYVVEAGNSRVLRFGSTVPTAPTITGFTPASGTAGTAVTITGTNFTGATAVSFGGINQSTYVIVSATSITTTVPTGAGTGFISVATPGGTAISATAFVVNGQNADAVLGQSNFTSSGSGTTATTFILPQGAAVDPTTGKLFVADGGNNRVMRYASAASFANGAAAEVVLGQANFTSKVPAATQASMNLPRAVAFDASGNLYVADAQNNRVLRFNAASSKANGANADGVLGQTLFTTNGAATTVSGMSFPCGVALDAAGNLYVGELVNHRVLRFNGAAGKANGAIADGVLGQSLFTTSTATISQVGMFGPQGVAVDASGNLYVADALNHRVLRFNAASSKANGANADGVLGQTLFTTNGSATSVNGMSFPFGVAVDASGNLYVADALNHRVLRFNAASSKANGANADGVFGQANFTSNDTATTQSGINRAVGVAVDAVGNLYVVDEVNNRVLRYGTTTLPVRWLSFTATRLLNKQVELNWQTASEINNARFEVQRGIKSGVFVTIGTVTGNGTTSNISNYTYTDTDAPAQGTLYYRLRQVDFDGAEDYSIVVEVNNDESVNPKWIVYPNPVSTYITLKSDDCAPGITFLRVYGSNGQVLLSKATTVEGCILNQAFDVSGLSQGFYVLEILNNGKAQHLRFVKQ